MFNHLHQALTQVQELQRRVVDNQMFRGWSGRARMFCGGLSLLTAFLLSMDPVPETPAVHLQGWGILCALAVTISSGALIYWFLQDPKVHRDVRRLQPTLQIFPPMLVGGVLTLGALQRQQYDWLFGIWMLCYGLANLAARRVLPRSIALVGIFYLIAGTVCIWLPLPFTNPWPMGLSFFVGEIVAGLILHLDQHRKLIYE